MIWERRERRVGGGRWAGEYYSRCYLRESHPLGLSRTSAHRVLLPCVMFCYLSFCSVGFTTSHLILSCRIVSCCSSYPILFLYFSNREVVWRLDIVDPQAVEHLLKSYRDILVETWRPARDAEPEFDA